MKKFFILLFFIVNISQGANDSVYIDLLASPQIQNHKFQFKGIKILNPFPYQNEIDPTLKFPRQLFYDIGIQLKFKKIKIQYDVYINNSFLNMSAIDKNGIVKNSDGSTRYLINRMDPLNPVITNKPKEVDIINNINHSFTFLYNIKEYLLSGLFFETFKWQFYDFLPSSPAGVVYYDSLRFPDTKITLNSVGIYLKFQKAIGRIHSGIGLKYGFNSNYKVGFSENNKSKNTKAKNYSIIFSLNWNNMQLIYCFQNINADNNHFEHTLHSIKIGISLNIAKFKFDFKEL